MEEVKKKRHRRTKAEMLAAKVKADLGDSLKFFKKPVEPLEEIAAQVTEMEPVVKKKAPKLVRDLEEKVEFLLEDVKSLRNYMCRFEDAFAAARISVPEAPILVTPKKYKRKRKP